MTPLFVYGSLLPGQPSAGFLRGRELVSATVSGRLYRVPAGYPALVVSPGNKAIEGELVLDADRGLLAVLDLFEGVHNGLYQRTSVVAHTASGPVSAQAYTVTAQQARTRGYRRLDVTDWRRIAPRL